MRVEQVLVVAVGIAFLFAAVSPLIPSGVYTQWHNVLYAAAAAWILATALYRIAKGESVWRINVLGVLMILVAMSVYMTYVNIYAKPASVQMEKDLEVLEDARQTYEKYFAQVAAHTATATSAIITVATVLAPFTLGLSTAVLIMFVDLAIDVINEFMSMVASYLGFAYSTLAVLGTLVRMVEIFPAVFAPIAAVAVPSKRVIATAAYLAAVPLLLAIAVATAPGLAPLSGSPQVEQEKFTQPVAVRINTNTPIVVEFKSPYVYHNGTHWINSSQWWWYTVPPPGANVTLTNGTWTLTRYIYMWVSYPVGTTFTLVLKNGTVAAGITKFNSTNATYIYPVPEATFNLYVPYKWFDGWSAAASLKPNITGITTDGKLNATWTFKYECYGTVSQCPGIEWKVDGLAAEFQRLDVKVLYTEYADVSHFTWDGKVSMDKKDWDKICNATQSAILSTFGASCSGWHPTRQWKATIDVNSQPKIECKTVGNETRCEEVETWHRAVVSVSLLYVAAPEPAVAGFLRGNRSTKDVVDPTFGYAFFALSSVFQPGAMFASLAAAFTEPFSWIWTSLIPWGLRLVYTLIAVTAGTAGVLIIVGAGAPILRILGLSQFFQVKMRMGSVETTILQLASKGLATAGRGGSVAGSVASAAAGEVAKDATSSWIRYAQMWAFYTSSALRWTVWLWRFDPIRLAVAAWLSAYIGSRTLMSIVIKAPHPRLQPAADAMAKLIEYTLRHLKGMHLLVHHGPPATLEGMTARYASEALDWVWATTHLRIDWMMARLIAYILHRAYHMSGGNMTLAALWTTTMLRPPRHTGDLAAFTVVYGIKAKPFPVHPTNLVEGFKLFRLNYTEEQAAARYLAYFGYDYARLKQAWETYKDWFTRNTDISKPEMFTYLPADSNLRRAIAEFAIERWKQGDHNALLFSPIPEFRRMAAEQLGVKVTPEGNTQPIWNMWLKGAAQAAARGDIETALRLAPGPMGQQMQLYEPLQTDFTSVNKLKGVMDDIVDKAAQAAGVKRSVVETGVWKMLEDPRMRTTLKLDGDYKKLEKALRDTVADILPPEIIKNALPKIMQDGETLKGIYELLKEDRPQWFESMPEHVQAQILEKLPYGDWSYVYSPKYAGEIADITWREIARTGDVVEHRVLDYLPPSAREAVAMQRLAALDTPIQPQAAPSASAAADYSQYARAMQMFGIMSYEVAEGSMVVEKHIRPEDLAAFGSPTEVRRMLAETAAFANASEKYYDEGRDYIPLKVEGKDEEEVERKLREFLEGQLQEIRDTARAAGLSKAEAEAAAERWLKMLTSSEYADFRDKLLELALEEDGPDAYMALLNMIEAAGNRATVKEPEATAVERLEEAVQLVPEQIAPVDVQFAPVEDNEPVWEVEEYAEAEVGMVKDEDHAEAVKRILGISFTEDDAVAYDVSSRYGLPHDVAARLAEDFGEYAKEVAKEVKRVDDWLAKAGADDEFRRRYIEQNLDRIVSDADSVIRELAEKAAEKAPKELQDLIAEDLAKGKFDEVNWKLSQIEQYCESKGGCTPEERRDLYSKL